MKSVIIDYGSGNLHSIRHKLIKVGIDACISNKKDDVKKADVIIISGVGHFSRAMENMRQNNLIDILNNKVLIDKTPVLGICLGMQLFTKFSEEGDVNGFGWLDANTCLFKFSKNIYKIPHIGWNLIKHKKISTLLNNIDSKQRFYFVHSYHVSCNNKDDIFWSILLSLFVTCFTHFYFCLSQI